MLNRLVLIGRLTKDPELRYTPNGKATCDFTLAVDRKFKNAQGEKETDFINCKVPPYKDKLAELCANYLSKGKLASIDGSIQIRTYNDKDGQKHWVTEAICEDVTFLSPKDENAGQAPAQNTQTQPPYSPPPYNAPPTGAPMGAPPSYGQQPQYGQPPTQPSYPGQFTPPGYAPPPQGYGQPPHGYGQPPGQQPSHPNMPNPNFPPHQQQSSQWLGGNPPQNPPGAGPTAASRFGHEVSLDDDIPF